MMIGDFVRLRHGIHKLYDEECGDYEHVVPVGDLIGQIVEENANGSEGRHAWNVRWFDDHLCDVWETSLEPAPNPTDPT
jgi:hypothetical protein